MRRNPSKPLCTLSRRQLLRALGAGGTAALFDPVNSLIAGVLGGYGLRAQAQASAEARKYLFLYLNLGPSRWSFDLPLRPYSGNNVIPSGGVNNAFVNGQPAYVTVPTTAGGETLNMPALWACNLPRPNGAPAAPMAALLENMIMIRGCDMQADGHPNNRNRQIYPLSGSPSLNGLVADSSSAPLSAVNLSGPDLADAFASAQGAGLLSWDAGDTQHTPLEQLMAPFLLDVATKDNALYPGRRALNDKIDNAIAKMQAQSTAVNAASAGLFHDRAGAVKLISTELGDLKGTYAALLAKYQGLIAGATAYDIPGVNAAPVPTAGLAVPLRSYMSPEVVAVPMANPDLRTLIVPATTVTLLAEGFAVAEFLLTKNYGAAVSVEAGFPVNLNPMTGGAPLSANFYNLDEHLHGTAVSTLVLAFYYRSIAACIFELVSQLKAQQMWENTVIHIGSEFNRSARIDGSGSDHGYEGGVTSLLSGAIKKPLVLGNIRQNASNATVSNPGYAGTWGAGAPVALDSTTGNLNIGNVSSTAADLLRVSRPMKNFSGLLDVKDTGITPLVEAAKNVA